MGTYNTIPLEKIERALKQAKGNKTKAAELLGVRRQVLQKIIQREKHNLKAGAAEKPLHAGRLQAPRSEIMPLPKEGDIARYVVSTIQNNTLMPDALWETITKGVCKTYKAKLLISRFAYNKNAFSPHQAKPGSNGMSEADEDLFYDKRAAKFICDKSVQLAPGLVFAGELNILPTAEDPLSGFDNYTGRKSTIVPHVTYAMKSIAAATKAEATKFLYTTGTLTERNYIQKKAGQKAEFHHCYGALLVEVDHEGNWWVRQLNADSDGVIYDKRLKFDGAKVTKNHRPAAITWGDIHEISLEPEMREAMWGRGGVLDQLSPREQHFHDVLDFRSQNHHDVKNPHRVFRKYIAGTNVVERELERCADFLDFSWRPWVESLVIPSNHHDAYERWLRDAEFKTDPANSIFYLESELALRKAIVSGDDEFLVFEWACRRFGLRDAVRFLRRDESHVICPEANSGIECGLHFDKGPNGTKGTPTNLSRLGRKLNGGDKHSAGIYKGVFIAGLMGNLDQGYNEGPSSWSQSFIVTYPNGKRAMYTVWNFKAWAE
jgi:hypothetical protein